PDRDEPAPCAECRYPSDVHVEAARVMGDHVGGHEEVRCVTRCLGSLVALDRVLDGMLVEAQLLRQLAERLVVGTEQLRPYQAVWFVEVVRDLLEREVLRLERPVAPHPCSYPHVRHEVSVPGYSSG